MAEKTSTRHSKPILLDALYINESGGKKLLDYLVRIFEETGLPVFYLLDARISSAYPQIPEERKKFLKAGLVSRLQFYRRHRSSFSKVLCFASIPPPVRMDCEVHTYYQYVMSDLAKKESGHPFKVRLLLRLKMIYISFCARYTTSFIVQTGYSAQALRATLADKSRPIHILPFYDDKRIYRDERIKKEEIFLYVSNGGAHKNHQMLLDVWEQLHQNGYRPTLALTVQRHYTLLYDRIQTLQSRGLAIINTWAANDEALNKEYNRAAYCVYPSLTESLGLGLVEAVDAGCKVIAADLPYTYEVISPSLAFDPRNENDLYQKIVQALTTPIPDSSRRMKNNIREIIRLLQQD